MIVRKRGKGKEKGVDNIELKKIVLIQDCRYILVGQSVWHHRMTSPLLIILIVSWRVFLQRHCLCFPLPVSFPLLPISFLPHLLLLLEVFTTTLSVRPSVASVGWSVCLFVGGKFHFHAPIGALINTNFVCSIQLKTGWKQVVWGGRVQNLKQFQFGN